MRRLNIAVLLFGMVFSGAHAQRSTKQPPSASSLKSRIPPAKPKLYRAIRDGRTWRNPYLIVNEDGVQIRKSGDDYAAEIVAVPEVLGVLEKLPTSAWPYGLVVAVQENGICCQYPDGDAERRANRVELLNRLNKAGVLVSLWPTG
jgi:hypothetical protein